MPLGPHPRPAGRLPRQRRRARAAPPPKPARPAPPGTAPATACAAATSPCCPARTRDELDLLRAGRRRRLAPARRLRAALGARAGRRDVAPAAPAPARVRGPGGGRAGAPALRGQPEAPAHLRPLRCPDRQATSAGRSARCASSRAAPPPTSPTSAACTPEPEPPDRGHARPARRCRAHARTRAPGGRRRPAGPAAPPAEAAEPPRAAPARGAGPGVPAPGGLSRPAATPSRARPRPRRQAQIEQHVLTHQVALQAGRSAWSRQGAGVTGRAGRPAPRIKGATASCSRWRRPASRKRPTVIPPPSIRSRVSPRAASAAAPPGARSGRCGPAGGARAPGRRSAPRHGLPVGRAQDQGRRRAVAEEAAPGRQPTPRVDHDPGRMGAGEVARGQARRVGQGRADADQDGVAERPHPMEMGKALAR